MGQLWDSSTETSEETAICSQRETKGNITRLYMGSNPIVYLLIIIGSVVNNSYYFSGIYYGQNTLQPTSKEGIIPLSIYR